MQPRCQWSAHQSVDGRIYRDIRCILTEALPHHMRRPAEPGGDLFRTEAAFFRELLERLDVENGELPQSGIPVVY
jgi:hypothetical protein